MRKGVFAFGCLAVLAIVALIGATALFISRLPDVSHQLPPNAAPLLVNLTTPLDSTVVPLNSPTSVQAAALGSSPITSLELWVDGNPAETKTAPQSNLEFDAFWSWLPDTPGEHTLVARATDAAHHVVSSNVVRINAAPGTDNAALVNYHVKPGDTLQSIAQKTDTTAEQLANNNPPLNSNNPITPGQVISIPQTVKPKAKSSNSAPTAQPTLQPTPQTTPQASNSLPSNPLASANFWASKNLVADKLLPQAPLLSAVANGCNAVLDFVNQADNVAGFFVYRTGAGNPQFTRIATLAPEPKNQSWAYPDNNVVGPLEYYVSAFNTLGESPSRIVAVNVTDPSCSLGYANGPLFNGAQLVPNSSIDKAYCYLSENSGAWARVPPAPDTFITPTNGAFDVSAYLKSLTTKLTSQMTLDLDCWGWKGDTLTYLGEAKETFTPQSNGPVQVPGDKFKFVGTLNLPPNIKPFDPTIIFPPTGLNATGDPSVCASHLDSLTVLFGGAQLCASAIQQHNVVLTWDWASGLAPNGQQAITDIEGYRVYENDIYFQHALVTSTSAGPDDKVGIFPLPVIPPLRKADLVIAAPQSLKRCFVARAYKANLESDDSNTVCIGDLPGTTTVVLSATATKTVWNRYTNSCAPADPNSVWSGQLVTGYQFSDLSRDVTIGCGAHDNWVLRTLARFDLSQIGVVSRATLKYQLYPGTSYGDNEDGNDPNRLQIPEASYENRSCAVELMLPTQDWSPQTNNNSDDNLIPADDYVGLPEQGSYYQVDVTSAVAHWHNFGGNYGFELRGANEDTGSEENSECYSEFRNFVLEVTFFPSSTLPANLANPGLAPAKP